ncbi:hypothetical protein [Cellulomonas gelida]|uniref:Uncharacterized protein n=1 Tax=Cellulomonas gelida TaxID=1712 RepID=A0A4Y3KNB0_9CELL|nr:hypothetical protein [Cellulomonas gelida]GEA84398.1 hypothetical protein CGE01nite_16490 [Cellulomonas gelida]GGL26374.1 hypothetical protein GCM10009774_16020 [Cellulomonas gelida]
MGEPTVDWDEHRTHFMRWVGTLDALLTEINGAGSDAPPELVERKEQVFSAIAAYAGAIQHKDVVALGLVGMTYPELFDVGGADEGGGRTPSL